MIDWLWNIRASRFSKVLKNFENLTQPTLKRRSSFVVSISRMIQFFKKKTSLSLLISYLPRGHVSFRMKTITLSFLTGFNVYIDSITTLNTQSFHSALELRNSDDRWPLKARNSSGDYLASLSHVKFQSEECSSHSRGGESFQTFQGDILSDRVISHIREPWKISSHLSHENHKQF